jgi:hypothetical protein
MRITREIISDVWPVYSAGEASADTKALVEEFLQQDPEFARLLSDKNADGLLNMSAPKLPPDHEIKALNQTKRLLFGPRWWFFFAMLFSFFAFGRIVSDTSWDVSPKPFIVTAGIAVAFWIVFFVRLISLQRSVLSQPRRNTPSKPDAI